MYCSCTCTLLRIRMLLAFNYPAKSTFSRTVAPTARPASSPICNRAWIMLHVSSYAVHVRVLSMRKRDLRKKENVLMISFTKALNSMFAPYEYSKGVSNNRRLSSLSWFRGRLGLTWRGENEQQMNRYRFVRR